MTFINILKIKVNKKLAINEVIKAFNTINIEILIALIINIEKVVIKIIKNSFFILSTPCNKTHL